MEVAILAVRLVVGLVLLFCCLYHWVRDDYPRATFYGVAFLMATRSPESP